MYHGGDTTSGHTEKASEISPLTAPDQQSSRGLTPWQTAVLVCGITAGSGILTFAKALDEAGWIGVFMIVFICIAYAYSACILGECWNILLERFPNELLHVHVRKPYSLIAEKAVGKCMSCVTSFVINFTLFGAACVLLIVSSQNTESLLRQAGVNVSICAVLIILGAFITPLLWLGTFKESWPVGLVVSIFSAMASLVILCCIYLDVNSSDYSTREVSRSPPTFISICFTFGTLTFAFGGTVAFPSIQQEMKEPSEFHKAVISSYIALLLMSLPVAITGYIAYGDALQPNILLSLSQSLLRTCVEVFMTLHFLFAIVLLLNPFAQELEEYLHIKQGFSWQRCVVRTALMASMLFVAETIPRFGALVNLIGGSGMTFTSAIAPSVFFLSLSYQKGNWPQRFVPLHKKVMCIEIIVLGTLAAIVTTYFAMQDITSSETFVPPCYINPKYSTLA